MSLYKWDVLYSRSLYCPACIIWAMAHHSVHRRRLLAAFAVRVPEREFLMQCRPRDVALITWGYARLGVRSRVLMATICAPVCKFMNHFLLMVSPKRMRQRGSIAELNIKKSHS
jgi:hypothetical protein